MSVSVTFKRTGRVIIELALLDKERHQPEFRLAQNWPHNLHKRANWPFVLKCTREAITIP